MQERLQKIISRAGIASRRAGEDIILAGRVRVNGRIITELGAKADLFEDAIEVDGRRLVPEAARYLVLHKPRGVVSTLSDPEGRPTVASLLESAGTRLYPVGRLDFATSGVLLVTNDGDFANGLLHPRGGVPKTYVVKTKGTMTPADLERWATGIELDDGKTLPADIHFLRHEEGKTWFEITLREGRNQQIRRMGETTGFPVMRLARVSFAGITSEGVRPGQWRALTSDELLDLRKQFGVPKRVRAPAPEERRGGPERPARRPTGGRAQGAAKPFNEGAASGPKPRAPSQPFNDRAASSPRPRAASERSAPEERRGSPERSTRRPTRESSTRESATEERPTRARPRAERPTPERATAGRAPGRPKPRAETPAPPRPARERRH
jgi:23S rRNA pseudouridine2605 synthase